MPLAGIVIFSFIYHKINYKNWPFSNEEFLMMAEKVAVTKINKIERNIYGNCS